MGEILDLGVLEEKNYRPEMGKKSRLGDEIFTVSPDLINE